MRPVKSNTYTPLKVSPEFQRKFKAEAASQGCSIFDYSLALAKSKKQIKEVFSDSDKSLQKGFKFEL